MVRPGYDAGSVRTRPDNHRRILGARRQDTTTANFSDVGGHRVEHGEREPGSGGKVGGMAAQVGEVCLERHPVARWPVTVQVAWRRPNGFDAGRPRAV